MKYFYTAILIFFATLTSGCYNFSTIQVYPISSIYKPNLSQENIKKIDTVVDNIPVIDQPGDKIITCGVFILPELPKTPPLPLDEINSISENDTIGLSKIERLHIVALREYIVLIKKIIKDAHNDYIQKCSLPDTK